MNEKLRPMTLGEILDRTAQLYRRNFWTFAGVAAVPMVATFAVFVPIGVALGVMGLFNAKQPTPSTGSLIGISVAVLFVGLPVLLTASVLMQGALFRAAIDAHMGSKLKVREAIRSVWPLFWRYLWLLVLQGLLVGGVPTAAVVLLFVGAGLMTKGGGVGGAVFVGFLAFVVFAAAFVYAIWRWLCYSMAMAACIVEEKPAWQSIQRANLLSKGTRWRIFVMYLLVGAITMLIAMIADVFLFIGMAIATAMGASKFGPAVLVVGEVLNLLTNFGLQTLITPVSVIALVLFYYDQRVRKEGYDIELMMEQAGLTAPAALPNQTPTLDASAPESPVIESPLAPPFEPGSSPDTVKES